MIILINSQHDPIIKSLIHYCRVSMNKELRNLKVISRKKQTTNQGLAEEAISLGCSKAKIILTKTILLGSWNKIQCQYGCERYGKSFTCPPCSPSVDEMSRILLDYHKAIIIESADTKTLRDIVVKLEESLKSKGFHKAFALSATACDLCETCTLETGCAYPAKARPSLRACGIDVMQTIFNNGWSLTSDMQPCSETLPIGMVLIN